MKRTSSHKRRWGTLIEAAKAGRVSRLIGRSRSEDSVCNSQCHDHSHSNSPPSEVETGVIDSPSDSNQSFEQPDTPASLEEHHETTSHVMSALAALRRKRKKFSDSRKTAGLETDALAGKNNKKVNI